MIELIIAKSCKQAFDKLYGKELKINNFYPVNTKKEFTGDYTIIVFPLLSYAKEKPEVLAEKLGNYLKDNLDIITDFNVVKGFLNLTIDKKYWASYSQNFTLESLIDIDLDNIENIVIEFSSPNTNKPLHLGHIRNNLLGVSISNILKFVGNNVHRVSLLNDRGIHICKTMLAWEKFGNKITPQKAGKKGDHLIGDFYVSFEKEYRREVQNLIDNGMTEEEAIQNSELLNGAKKLLKKWERGNKNVLETWKLLNSWVIDGFNKTYKELGVEFDKIYFESDTYLKGKDIVMRELSKGTVKLNPDNSVSIDLSDVGLDEKILLRSDGTSVYITQDIGTAVQRFEEYNFDKQIYVVGNEQIYHFKVLKEILKKFGYDWYDRIIHFSYGMVELPEGKMKSREGKVVDADDLIQEMYDTARKKSEELGKLDDLPKEEADEMIKIIAMGALKYFILKIDPRKNMMFNPEESIDFNGNTGPFIQYTYTRINSLIRKAKEAGIEWEGETEANIEILDKEVQLIKEIYNFKTIVKDSARVLNPASIANYVYNLAKLFNSYYQETTILKANDQATKKFRLHLANNVAITIKTSLKLLGIDVPKRM
jgi:arginyl-tRNA synthetase